MECNLWISHGVCTNICKMNRLWVKGCGEEPNSVAVHKSENKLPSNSTFCLILLDFWLEKISNLGCSSLFVFKICSILVKSRNSARESPQHTGWESLVYALQFTIIFVLFMVTQSLFWFVMSYKIGPITSVTMVTHSHTCQV